MLLHWRHNACITTREREASYPANAKISSREREASCPLCEGVGLLFAIEAIFVGVELLLPLAQQHLPFLRGLHPFIDRHARSRALRWAVVFDGPIPNGGWSFSAGALPWTVVFCLT